MERANHRSSFVEDGIDRIQSAFQSVEGEFEKIQHRVGDGRKDFEKRLRSGRKDLQKSTKKLQKRVETRRRDFEKQTEKRVKSWQKELRRYAIVRRAEGLAEDATKRIENGMDSLLSNLQIATSSDVKKIDRKLSQINRKLKALEDERSQPAKTSKSGEAAA
jgi:uncharacterized phage infection (PIP) family protein YhgE